MKHVLLLAIFLFQHTVFAQEAAVTFENPEIRAGDEVLGTKGSIVLSNNGAQVLIRGPKECYSSRSGSSCRSEKENRVVPISLVCVSHGHVNGISVGEKLWWKTRTVQDASFPVLVKVIGVCGGGHYYVKVLEEGNPDPVSINYSDFGR